MRKAWHIGAVVLVIPLVCSVCGAYPTSLNLIPTADVIGEGTVAIQLEWDGDTAGLCGEGYVYFMTQVGVTDRVEAGIDLFEVGRETDVQGNLKWQCVAERPSRPAVAIGAMDIARLDSENGWYVALAKDVGPVRLHGGLMADGVRRGMLGAEHYFSDRTGLLADWTTGPEAYHTIGLTQDLGEGFWASAYYARNNTRDAGDFLGLNIYWEGGWRD